MLKPTKPSKILFQLTGSIAAYKACTVISRLVQQGHEVQIVASKQALEFVGPATLEGLTGRPIFTDIQETGRKMDHIHLARWADLAVICPATANTMNRLAAGIADDAIGSLFLAYELNKKPYLIVPAMNHQMWSHPTTQNSIRSLQSYGVTILPVADGAQACGETGPGRMIEPEEIIQRMFSTASRSKDTRGKIRWLITGGATRERIDSVRFLSNISSGRTSASLADMICTAGFEVTLLRGEGSAVPQNSTVQQIEFSDTQDLANKLQAELQTGRYSVVIHAAAVSDFTPEKPFKGKINSTESLSIQLKQTPKLIDKIRAWSPTPIKVIAFKLTDTSNRARQKAAIDKLARSKADWIVHNDLSDLSTNRRFRMYRKNRRDSTGMPLQGVQALANAVIEFAESSFKKTGVQP